MIGHNFDYAETDASHFIAKTLIGERKLVNQSSSLTIGQNGAMRYQDVVYEWYLDIANPGTFKYDSIRQNHKYLYVEISKTSVSIFSLILQPGQDSEFGPPANAMYNLLDTFVLNANNY